MSDAGCRCCRTADLHGPGVHVGEGTSPFCDWRLKPWGKATEGQSRPRAVARKGSLDGPRHGPRGTMDRSRHRRLLGARSPARELPVAFPPSAGHVRPAPQRRAFSVSGGETVGRRTTAKTSCRRKHAISVILMLVAGLAHGSTEREEISVLPDGRWAQPQSWLHSGGACTWGS